MDQGRLEGLSESCEYDMCSVKDDILETICFHAEAVVEECQLTTGIVIADWRTPDFCGELVFTWKQGSGKAREGWRGGVTVVPSRTGRSTEVSTVSFPCYLSPENARLQRHIV